MDFPSFCYILLKGLKGDCASSYSHGPILRPKKGRLDEVRGGLSRLSLAVFVVLYYLDRFVVILLRSTRYGGRDLALDFVKFSILVKVVWPRQCPSVGIINVSHI